MIKQFENFNNEYTLFYTVSNNYGFNYYVTDESDIIKLVKEYYYEHNNISNEPGFKLLKKEKNGDVFFKVRVDKYVYINILINKSLKRHLINKKQKHFNL